MHGIYTYHGPNKSVPYHYVQQSFPTHHHYQQHQPLPPVLMQRQRRSWKNKTPVVVSPPNLTIPERPHSDSFLFPRDKHSSGYPVVFPHSKSATGARIHLCDIKVPPPSSSSAICQRDPLVTTSKIPLDVSSMSNHRKKSNYALNTTTASSSITQLDSSPSNQQRQYTKNQTDTHHRHHKQPTESSSLDHQRKKHHQQQDRRRFSATLDSQPVPHYRRFSHPENYSSQPTGAGQIYHFPYHRHSHHHPQQRHQHQTQNQQQQQYYHLAASAYVYPPLSMTGYSSPHGMYAQPHQHHSSYYQPYQGYSPHSTTYSGIQKSNDHSPTDDDDNKQQRRISTNTDTTSTMSSSDMAPRRFSSGSTGSSSKSTLASSMSSVGIWNTDSISSTASTKTTTTTMTTPAISSAAIAAAATTNRMTATKVDQPPLDPCDSSTMTHDPAATTTITISKDSAQTATDDDNGSVPLATALTSKTLDGALAIGDDLTLACDTSSSSTNHHLNPASDNKLEGDSSSTPHTAPSSQQEQTTHCLSTSTSSNSSSASSAPLSPTPPSNNPSAATLPIWADPIKVRDNPTRYKVIQDYMAEHKLSYTSSLPLPKDIVFYFGDTKTTMANYRSSMQKLFSSTTVWGFSSCWRRYKETPGRKPSQMATNQNLYCFQKGVEPMWEDEVNKHGGRLILCLAKQLSLDDLFDWLLCAFVGGQLAAEGMVGLVLSRRARLDRMELWLDATSSTNPDTIISVKNKLLKILPVALHEPVISSHYKKHYDQ